MSKQNKQSRSDKNKDISLQAGEASQAAAVALAGRAAEEHETERRLLKGDSFEDPKLPDFSLTGPDKTVGECLREERIRQNFSYNEVAARLSCNSYTVQAMESGELVQPSAREFTRELMGKYAAALGLDVRMIQSMYDAEVDRHIDVVSEQSEKKESSHMFSRVVLPVIMMLAVAGGGYYFFGSDHGGKKDESGRGELLSSDMRGELEDAPVRGIVIESPSAAGSASGGAASDLALSSDPAVTAVSSASDAADSAAVVISAPENQNAPKVIVTDENTMRARAQAQALRSGEGGSASAPVARPSLPLGEEAARSRAERLAVEGSHEDPSVGATSETAQSDTDGKKPSAKDAAGSAAMSDLTPGGADANVTAEIRISAESAKQGKDKAEDTAKESKESKETGEAGTAAAQSDVTAKGGTDAKSEKPERTKRDADGEKDKAALALSKKLKDISDAVKVVDRNDIGSLNRVEISALAPVYVRITSSGKVLKEGAFDKGDSLSVTGIPPLTVAVTSTKAVKIMYAGGTLKTPDTAQAEFKLPL